MATLPVATPQAPIQQPPTVGGGTVSTGTIGTPSKFPTTGSGSSTPSTGNPLIDSLTGTDRDAAVFLQNLFASYGLGTLAPVIVQYLKSGYSADTISLLLQQTPEYKARFAANDARLKAGLPVLSPAEYISTENAYRQVLSSYGLPPGFYDNNSDFTNWIAGDVSPTEIQQRVQVASDLVTNADPATLNAFKSFYGAGQGDLIAYALDRTVAEPLLEKQYRAAQIAGAAANNALGINQSEAEMLAGAGITQGQAQQGFGQVGQDAPTVRKLDDIYGGNVSTDDLVHAVFLNQADASQKVNALASQERSAFGGTSGTSATALNKRDSGQL